MRLNINLATQPYEDAKRFITIWVSILGGLLLLLLLLGIGVFKEWRDYRHVSVDIARERQVLADLDVKQQQGLAILNKPDNRDLRDKSDFLNELIRRKQVSWTRIFTDLEQIMPGHVRVIAIEPRVTEDQVLLEMQLASDNRDRVAELARRMEKSNVFRDTVIFVEDDSQTQGDAGRFQIRTEYVPGEPLTKPESEKSESRGGE